MSHINKTIVLSILALLLAGSIVSCGSGGAQTVQVSEQDAGKTIEVAKGGKLEVALKGNITTGYNWSVESVDTAILKQTGEPDYKADTNLAGSPGIITLPFEAVGAGQTTLKLIYSRSFEKGVPPLQTFEVNIVVK